MSLPKRPAFRVERVGWARADRLARALAARIVASGFKPNLIVAIARGGLIPARLLADRLLVRDIASFRIEHYWLSAGAPKKARLMLRLPVPIAGRKVLLVDDITDTGDTLALAVRYLRAQRPAQLRSAVLQHKLTAHFKPDFVGQIIRRWRWITYPWAAYEDALDLSKRVYKLGMSAAALRAALLRRFGVKFSIAELSVVLRSLRR